MRGCMFVYYSISSYSSIQLLWLQVCLNKLSSVQFSIQARPLFIC